MELRRYLMILWRHKWVIIVTTVVTVGIVLVSTLRATPIYAASTTVRVATETESVSVMERLLNTYAELATSNSVLAELAQKLGLDEPPPVDVEVLANTELIRITVEDANPVLASQAANELAKILIARSKKLDAEDKATIVSALAERLKQIGEELAQARREYKDLVAQNPGDPERIAAVSQSIKLKEEIYATLLEQYEQARVRAAMQSNTLTIIDPAAVPQTPSKPRRKLNIALGAMVGLGGGLALAFLFESLSTVPPA